MSFVTTSSSYSSSTSLEQETPPGGRFMATSSSTKTNLSLLQSNQLVLDHHHHRRRQQHHVLPDNNDNHNHNLNHQFHHHQLQQQHHQMSYGMMMQPITSSSTTLNRSSSVNLMSKDGGGYDQLGEFDQALFLYLDGHDNPSSSSAAQDQRQNSGMRPPTLNIFPSKPMHVDPSLSSKAISSSTMGLVSPATSGSKRSSEQSMDLSNSTNNNNPKNGTNAAVPAAPPPPAPPSDGPPPAKTIKREGNGPPTRGVTSSSEHERPKTPDPKTLRRLAQNREAARKSRLRKKAYVQQLESSRIKLTQLEQELQRARVLQGSNLIAGGGILGAEQQALNLGMGNMSSDAAVFEMEYGRWVEEHNRLLNELQAAINEHLPENELRMYVDNCFNHFGVMMNLKSMLAKTDVFHLVSGTWKTPAERCFMWMGGFRPSELIKIVVNQVEPLSEQQLVGVYGLQQSTHEAEESLSQGLDSLNQSLSDIIISESLSVPQNVANYMGQMSIAMNKLATLEGFVRQADSLRLQTIHRIQQLMTVRQAARCFIAIGEYFHRLRTLSSLWMARPRQE